MRTIRLITIAIITTCLISFQVFAQSHNHSITKEIKAEIKNRSEKSSNTVRKGTIDLKAIDKNKDGKVYQDQMDWNVISDAPGNCPLCKMKLMELPLKDVKANLIKNGFKVK